MNNRKVILIALILGVSTALAINIYLNKLKAAVNNIKTTRVVMAAQDIPAKTEITSAMVADKEIPADLAHPKGYLKREEVVGKITTGEILQGEQILVNRLAGLKDNQKGLGYSVTKGKRAVSVAVDDVSGLSGLVKPGDKVDVLVTMSVDNTGKKVTFTRMFLENIPVLAVGVTMSDLPEPEKEEKNRNQEGLKTVTLEVYAKDTQPLTMANEQGRIRLALRSPVDESKSNLGPYLMEQLLNKQ
ncbi:MAG: Flp pilus assembly protein CpaB [Clostridia bacterium]|nr:Flp pilus assembly protein CpaB [Clostridia bacterium]